MNDANLYSTLDIRPNSRGAWEQKEKSSRRHGEGDRISWRREQLHQLSEYPIETEQINTVPTTLWCSTGNQFHNHDSGDGWSSWMFQTQLASKVKQKRQKRGKWWDRMGSLGSWKCCEEEDWLLTGQLLLRLTGPGRIFLCRSNYGRNKFIKCKWKDSLVENMPQSTWAVHFGWEWGGLEGDERNSNSPRLVERVN